MSEPESTTNRFSTKKIVSVFRLIFQFVIEKIIQFVLSVNLALSTYIIYAIKYPNKFLLNIPVGMLFADIPHFLATIQIILNTVSLILLLWTTKASFITKTILAGNYIVLFLFVKQTYSLFSSFSTFKSAFQNVSMSTKFFEDSYRLLPPSKAEFLPKMSPFFSVLLGLIPFLENSSKFFHAKRKTESLEDASALKEEIVSTSYASLEELQPILLEKNNSTNLRTGRGNPKRWLDIDILRNQEVIKHAKNKTYPVLIYVHGGGWVVGDKAFALQGSLNYIFTKFNVVVVRVNYRLAPESNGLNMLLDVKRAVCWVKRNIHLYGGDSNKICLAGESAGAHLVTLCGLSNQALAFPNMFNDVANAKEIANILEESSVNCVIDIYGIHNNNIKADKVGMKRKMVSALTRNFVTQVSKSDIKDKSEYFSPNCIMESFIGNEKKVPIPAFAVLHGTNDVLTSLSDAKAFYNLLRRYRYLNNDKTKDFFTTIPGGHHATGYIQSPRAISIALGMVNFMDNVFEVVPQPKL